ncbi:hypothetical protein TWF696_005198 [Orbilia brochopaga]|uniref:Uncharacterized protein n=1 Tax=Orbilia brochopaga TaxID=3140254 RepID=A0AAV9V012_9PEZI
MLPSTHSKQEANEHGDLGRSPLKWNGGNSLHGPTNTSLAKYPAHAFNRDRSRIEPMHSPSKRTKFSTFTDGFYSPQQIPKNRSIQATQRDLGRGRLNSGRISQDSIHTSGALRKQYLAERDTVNSLRRGLPPHGPPSGRFAQKLPSRQSRETSDYDETISAERGVRWSRTPPPLSLDPEGSNEVPLPPTPDPPRNRSPGTIRKDREELFGSGRRKPKRKHGSLSYDSSSEPSPGLQKTYSIRSNEAPNYYPSSSVRIKDRFRNTFVEHREALRREIQILEDELIIERRKSSIVKYSSPKLGNVRDLLGFISQCLSSNDQATRTEAIGPDLRHEYLQSLNVRPLEVLNTHHGLRQFCHLSFASNNTPDPHMNRRVFKGYSDKNLLQFRISVDVVGNKGPTVEKLRIECSDWGLSELGQPLRKFSRERNVSKAIHAISSFSDLAQARAKLWADLRHQFSQLTTSKTYESTDLLGIPVSNISKASRRKLVENLSKRVITFRGRNISASSSSVDAELSLGWHIHFDATGEARSHIFASVKALSNVMVADEGKITEQVSTLLNMLVAEYGILEGTSKLLKAFFHTS